MSCWRTYLECVIAELSLNDLAAASGIEPRTIRSWVAQGLLPGPLNRGPAATYPADTLERILAIRAMRDLNGMPLSAIRQELLVATSEQLRAYAGKAAPLPPPARHARAPAEPTSPNSVPNSALDYLRELRAGTGAAAAFRAAPAAPGAPAAPRGFEGLEQTLAQGRAGVPTRRTRAEEWLHLPITPDVEMIVRGRLNADQRARLERCADLIRDILLGVDR